MSSNNSTVTQSTVTKNDWFKVEPKPVSWLVDGLIPSDGHTAIVGKAKAGKSSSARCLGVAVIKEQKFLGRSVEVPEGGGTVLYIHLDRKDIPWRLYKELRDLGITEEESKRFHIRTAEHLPGVEERLKWLQSEVSGTHPQLIVIDLLWQFLNIKNGNEYNDVLAKINALQDALSEVKYAGALVVVLHARKAINLDDEADDIIGSSAQRGSFITGIYLTRDRNAGHYTIMSDQTLRDDVHGEIEKSILIRNPDGTLSIGQPVRELAKQDKLHRQEADLQKIINFVGGHPGCDVSDIMAQLMMSKKYIFELIDRAQGLFRREGGGIKGDPFLYYLTSSTLPSSQAA